MTTPTGALPDTRSDDVDIEWLNYELLTEEQINLNMNEAVILDRFLHDIPYSNLYETDKKIHRIRLSFKKGMFDVVYSVTENQSICDAHHGYERDHGQHAAEHAHQPKIMKCDTPLNI